MALLVNGLLSNILYSILIITQCLSVNIIVDVEHNNYMGIDSKRFKNKLFLRWSDLERS